ncbi:MAG: winged helix DNA-binding domain-containing protein [Paludibacteraceae bacterium]
MNLRDIAIHRLHAQQLTKPHCSSPLQVVEWMGAVQAQDLPMALLAIVLRSEGGSVKSTEKAFDSNDIVRTHLMRPTWHIVSREDIYWMLDLTSSPIRRIIKRRHSELEMDSKLLYKANILLEKELQGKEFSRKEIVEVFKENNIKTDENRLSHFLMYAEMEQLICSGSLAGRLQTYALLEEKVPEKKRLSREDSILKLTQRYFNSHAPATIADFAWWSGLTLKEIRWALHELRHRFDSLNIGEETYYFPFEIKERELQRSSIHLLPAYDEFLVSYKSKHVCINNVHHRKAVSVNGIFTPIIVQDGQIVGTWKKKAVKKSVEIETNWFENRTINVNNQINHLKKILL